MFPIGFKQFKLLLLAPLECFMSQDYICHNKNLQAILSVGRGETIAYAVSTATKIQYITIIM